MDHQESHVEEEICLVNSTVLEQFLSSHPVGAWVEAGMFEVRFLDRVNPHWLQFPPASPLTHYLLAAVYVILMAVGLGGNALVAAMLLSCRSLRTPANLLVANLAVSDFLMMAEIPILVYNSIKLGPAIGEIGDFLQAWIVVNSLYVILGSGCELYGFTGGLSGTVSIATLAAIAVDRYNIILYPTDPATGAFRRTTRHCAFTYVCVTWVYGALFASLPLLGVNQYVPEGYLTSCSFDYLAQDLTSRTFILIFFVGAWVVPFTIITFCYANICATVFRVRRGDGLGTPRQQYKKTELKLTGVVIGIICLWFCAWTPYAVVALLGVAGRADLISPLASMVPALFCKTASCLDPFIYGVTHPRFRKEFLRRFCAGKGRSDTLRCRRVVMGAGPGALDIRAVRVSLDHNDDLLVELSRPDLVGLHMELHSNCNSDCHSNCNSNCENSNSNHHNFNDNDFNDPNIFSKSSPPNLNSISNPD